MSETKFDFATLRVQVREAAREAFTLVRNSHPGEHFYAFALYSDDDGSTICPAANSTEGLDRNLSKAGIADSDKSSAYYRWATAEWAYESDKGGAFTAICAKLLDASLKLDSVRSFRKRVYQVMIDALKDLNNAGFFGTGTERDSVTVFCTISDSNAAGRLENRSAAVLNPRRVYRRFFWRYGVLSPLRWFIS